MSATVVPCPGSRGSSTEWPSATMASAMGRIDDGLPVKPWITRQPTGPPATESGSASGATSGMAGGYALQEHCQFEEGYATTSAHKPPEMFTAAGPRMTTNSAGRQQKTSGDVILTR